MSKGLPIRRQQFDTQGFAAWLAGNGAEIGVPTNPYEVIRYRAYGKSGGKAQTHIVYTKDTGLLTFTGKSRDHYTAFIGGVEAGFAAKVKVPVAPVSHGAKTRAKLLERDGDECWFCGKPMGADATLEHLVPKSKGGGNKLDNYALAHAACNHRAANIPLVKKIEMRMQMRATPEAAAERDGL